MDLTPRQRADIVHVVLAHADDLGIKIQELSSTREGRGIRLHLHADTARRDHAQMLFDSLRPSQRGDGLDQPGTDTCPPYSTVEGKATICGESVAVVIFADFEATEPEPAGSVTECDPDPECTGCGSQHCAGCDAVPAGQPAQCWPAGSVTT